MPRFADWLCFTAIVVVPVVVIILPLFCARYLFTIVVVVVVTFMTGSAPESAWHCSSEFPSLLHLTWTARIAV